MLGKWLGDATSHLQTHWQGHLIPTLAVIGASMVFSMLLVFVMFGGMVLSAVLGETVGDSGAMVGLGITAGLFGLSMLLLIGLMQPLMLGHARLVLQLTAPQEPQADSSEAGAPLAALPPAAPAEAVAALRWGLVRAPKALGLIAIQATAGVIGAIFCYVPALLVGAAFFVATPAMADRDCGPLQAVSTSWRLVRPRFWSVLALVLALTVLSMVLAYIPLVGPMITLALFVTVQVVVYRSLAAAEDGAAAQLP